MKPSDYFMVITYIGEVEEAMEIINKSLIIIDQQEYIVNKNINKIKSSIHNDTFNDKEEL